MIIRAAHRADAERCAKILRAWMEENSWFQTPHHPEEDEGFMTSLIVGGWTSVIEDASGIAGFLVQDKTWVNCLYVAKDCRGKGYGKLLLDHAKNMRTEGLQLWVYQDNTDAQRFFLREGFHEVERTSGTGNDEKLPDIRYIWRMFNEA